MIASIASALQPTDDEFWILQKNAFSLGSDLVQSPLGTETAIQLRSEPIRVLFSERYAEGEPVLGFDSQVANFVEPCLLPKRFLDCLE